MAYSLEIVLYLVLVYVSVSQTAGYTPKGGREGTLAEARMTPVNKWALVPDKCIYLFCIASFN